MAQEKDIKTILEDATSLLENCKQLNRETDAMKHGIDFLLNEYKANKRYFRENPGRVTIEDVIKTCFEFGWASKSQFDYTEKQKFGPSLETMKNMAKTIENTVNEVREYRNKRKKNGIQEK